MVSSITVDPLYNTVTSIETANSMSPTTIPTPPLIIVPAACFSIMLVEIYDYMGSPLSAPVDTVMIINANNDLEVHWAGLGLTSSYDFYILTTLSSGES